MRYTIEILFDKAQYKLSGFMSVENYDVDDNFLLFRLENNFERNQLLYHKKDKGICIKKILDSKMREIDYEILQLECKRVFCKARTKSSKVYVQYDIPIKILDGCIRLEDSVYGGLSCYPRLVNTKKITSVDFSNNVIFLNDNVDCKCFIGPKYKNKIMEVFNHGNFSNNLDSNDDTE